MKKYLSDGKKEVEDAMEAARPRGGRAVFVTEEMRNAMLTAIASGLTTTEASMALGLSKEWISGEVKNNPEFEVEVNKSIQSFKLYHLSNISRHAKKSWQASAWILERSFPERFNSRIAQDLAARAKPKEAPKWFNKEIEDIEIIEETEIEENGSTKTDGDKGENAETTKEATEENKATKIIL